MKTKIILMLLALFSIMSLNVSASNKKEKKNNKVEVLLDVPMTCHSCQKKIERNIPFEKGITDMKVDLPSKTVMVQYDPNKTTLENVQQAFSKLGYEASIHKKDTSEEK